MASLLLFCRLTEGGSVKIYAVLKNKTEGPGKRFSGWDESYSCRDEMARERMKWFRI